MDAFTEQEGPVLELPHRSASIQSAAWSPWQSSVVAIGLANGLVEIWDILVSTCRPQRQIRISRSAITALGFGKDEGGTFIAISDADGAGKITLLPFHTDSLSPDLKEVTVDGIFFSAINFTMPFSVSSRESSRSWRRKCGTAWQWPSCWNLRLRSHPWNRNPRVSFHLHIGMNTLKLSVILKRKFYKK